MREAGLSTRGEWDKRKAARVTRERPLLEEERMRIEEEVARAIPTAEIDPRLKAMYGERDPADSVGGGERGVAGGTGGGGVVKVTFF